VGDFSVNRAYAQTKPCPPERVVVVMVSARLRSIGRRRYTPALNDRQSRERVIEARLGDLMGSRHRICTRVASGTSLLGSTASALILLACGAGAVAQPGPGAASPAQPIAQSRARAETAAPSQAATPVAAAAKPEAADELPSFDGPIEAAPVSAEGLWVLSRRYWKGVGVHQTPGLAYAFARRAASEGSAPAVAWLKSRAESDPFARLHLGVLLTDGPAELSDKPHGEALMRDAVAKLEARAAQGDPEASTLLGYCYLQAQGAAKDPAKALTQFQRAAAAGEPEAQNTLGDLLYNAYGVPKDLVKAADWYRRSAEAGSGTGQSNYAYVLNHGEGVRADAAAALKWYRMSAERGSPNAQRNLALMLMEGNPSPAVASDALGWFARAANQNSAAALQDLARLYAEGKYVTKDVARAKELASRSAQLGHEPAKQWLAKLAEREKCEQSAETKLFDIALACADRGTLRRSISASGGKAQREDARFWYDVYASAGLLVDSTKLSVGYTNADDFAIAEYDFGTFVGDDELDRTIDLLVPKYGRPQITKTGNGSRARWTQRDGIVVELERSPRNLYLRYFQPARRTVLEQEMATDKGEQRRREIAKQSRAF
jgi:TPR repeat protein